MYVVLAGEVDLQRGGRTIETARVGAIVGEMAMIDKAPRSATAIAKTDCRLVPIDEKRSNSWSPRRHSLPCTSCASLSIDYGGRPNALWALSAAKVVRA